uniref:Uncharacterized protein n=1 Tax=Anguilla anguilla TaxID=7936 RepID=A0A0E9W4G8_ANGAN
MTPGTPSGMTQVCKHRLTHLRLLKKRLSPKKTKKTIKKNRRFQISLKIFQSRKERKK